MYWSKKRVITAFKKAFPEISGVHDGADWYGHESNSVHLGDIAEGGTVNGVPGADYWAEDYEEKVYTFGVHNDINKFFNDKGWFVECHDPGTYFAYPE